MNLKYLSNIDLLSLAKEKSKDDRAASLVAINVIREVEDRRLHLELGYGSLFEYVLTELGYDESAANRRITAARLTRQIPAIEDKIAQGKLTLSNLVQAQVFFNREAKLKNQKVTLEEKREILELIENKSKREAEKVLLKKSPEQVTLKESTRQITEHQSEMRLIIDEEFKADLEKLRSLLSHKNPFPSNLELLKEMAKIALKELDPTMKTKKRKSPPPAPEARRYTPISIKKSVWEKSQSQCTYVDPKTKRQCNSTYKLEIHHKIPFAMGGPTTKENLTLLCHKHNIFEAIKAYGITKMEPYIQSSR